MHPHNRLPRKRPAHDRTSSLSPHNDSFGSRRVSVCLGAHVYVSEHSARSLELPLQSAGTLRPSARRAAAAGRTYQSALSAQPSTAPLPTHRSFVFQPWRSPFRLRSRRMRCPLGGSNPAAIAGPALGSDATLAAAARRSAGTHLRAGKEATATDWRRIPRHAVCVTKAASPAASQAAADRSRFAPASATYGPVTAACSSASSFCPDIQPSGGRGWPLATEPLPLPSRSNAASTCSDAAGNRQWESRSDDERRPPCSTALQASTQPRWSRNRRGW